MSETPKEGDLMVLNEGGWSRSSSIVPVHRVTATQVLVRVGYKNGDRTAEPNTRRFRRGHSEWMHEVGEYANATIRPATPELIAEIREDRRRRAALRALRDAKWADMTTDQLVRIAELAGILAAAPPEEVDG